MEEEEKPIDQVITDAPIQGNGTEPHVTLPRGRIVGVTFTLALPAAATRAEVEEWVSMHLSAGSMGGDNPLGHYEPEALGAVVLTDVGKATDYLDRRDEVLGDILARMPREDDVK